MIIQFPDNLEKLMDVTQIAQRLSSFMKDLKRVINGRLNFQDNFHGQFIDVTFPNSNQEVRVNHSLPFVPTGFIVVRYYNNNVTVYDGTSEWSTSSVFLKCSAFATVKIYLF